MMDGYVCDRERERVVRCLSVMDYCISIMERWL